MEREEPLASEPALPPVLPALPPDLPPFPDMIFDKRLRLVEKMRGWWLRRRMRGERVD